MTDGWLDEYRELSLFLTQEAELEGRCTRIRAFNCGVIPGLLQTPAYARQITTTVVTDPDLSDLTIRLRLSRQERIAVPQLYVLDQAVLMRQVGGITVMIPQLRYLAGVIEQDARVTIRVIPFAAGEYPGMGTSFHLLDFADGSPVLWTENAAEFALDTGNRPRITRYHRVFWQLLSKSLPPEQSLELIKALS